MHLTHPIFSRLMTGPLSRFSLLIKGLLFCLLMVAVPAAAAPTLGVMPIAMKKRAKKKDIRKHRKLEKKLKHALAEFDFLPLKKNKREKMLRIRKTRLRKNALKRARKAKRDFVLTFYSKGRGRRLTLSTTLFDVKTGKRVWRKVLRPFGKDKKNWTEQVKNNITPFLKVEAEAEPTTPPTNTQKSEQVSKKQAPNEPAEPDSPTSTDAEKTSPEDEQVATSRPPTDPAETAAGSEEESGGGLGWLWYGSSAAVGLLSVGALAGGGTFAALAWSDSTQLVAGDTTSGLKESSVQKAMIADALFVTGGVLALCAGGLLTVGLLSGGSDEE